MSRDKWDGRIPISAEGHLCLCPALGDDVKWVGKFTWEGELLYIGCVRGRSAARFQFQLEDGKRVEMFLSDFCHALETVGMTGQSLHGEWKFVKRGRYFAVALV